MKKIALAFLILIIFARTALADGNGLVTIDVKDLEIREILRMFAVQSSVNIVADNTVIDKATISLRDTPLNQALETLLGANGYQYEQINNIYVVSKNKLNLPLFLVVQNGKMTIRARNVEINQLMAALAAQGVNIVAQGNLQGIVTIQLTDVPLDVGLRTIAEVNGFLLNQRDGIFRIAAGGDKSSQMSFIPVKVENGLVTLSVQNADVIELMKSITNQAGLDIVVFGSARETVDLQLNNVPVNDAIRIILAGTRLGYKREGNILMLGDVSSSSGAAQLIAVSEVIPLKYVKAEDAPALLTTLGSGVNIKVLKEQNALNILGTSEQVNKLKEEIAKIDKRVPQIVVEAWVLEDTGTDDLSYGVETKYAKGRYSKENVGDFIFNSSVVKLEKAFWAKLSMLETEGKIKVRARPNITTISGREATIDVGSTRYYSVTESTGTGTSQVTTTSLKTIDSGITLKIVPWVGDAGEITIELHPKVSNQTSGSGTVTADVSRKSVDTVVRVKNGETIIIGGLIQNENRIDEKKIPILGDIPLLGNLFKTTSKNEVQTELKILITPKILGDGGINTDNVKEGDNK